MFYSNGAYSLFKVDTPIISGGSTPSYQNEYSFQFDGIDEYIQTDSNYSQTDGQSKITISAWIKVTTGTDSLSYLCSVGGGTFVSFAIRLQQTTSNTRCYVYVNNAGNNNRSYANLGNLKNDGLWHHLLICLDLSLSNYSEALVYLDGNARTMSGYFNNGSLPTSTSALFIGAKYNDITNIYGGLIDEFAIWSGTDLRNDVSTIYNNGIPNNLNDNGLTAPTTWFRNGENATFDGIRDWNLVDQGSGGNDATSQNMVQASRVLDVPPNPFVNTLSTSFDGIDDYVELNSPTSIQSLTSEITISFWIKAPRVFSTNYYTPLSKGEYGATGSQWSIKVNTANARNTIGGTFTTFSDANAISGRQNLNFITPVDDNQWHHMMFVNDGTDLKIYLDGQLEATGIGQGGTLYDGNRSLKLGRLTATSSTGLLQGNLDEVAIFSNALALSDAQVIYNSGVPSSLSSYSSLVSWWRCGDGDTSPTLTDNGSGGNDGTMTNMSSANFVTDVPT